MCALEPTGTLLVCADSRLMPAARCPKSCFDEGAGAGLYCMDEGNSLRFAPGFICPDFPSEERRACGADGAELLVCRGSFLASTGLTCATCDQRKTGEVTCLDANGAEVPLPE